MANKHHLFWLDLEMTGLDPEINHILQIAAVVTDHNLNVCAQGSEIVIHQPADYLLTMPPIVRDMHTHSGLLAQVKSSGTSLSSAEKTMIEFFNQHCIPEKTLLCGNSIWVDRMFLRMYMPTFEKLFHYRMVDVSTIKELVAGWYPDAPHYKKAKNHTAHADIEESIGELRYYREKYF